jgi:glycolate oxidase iron-sulfur subunit
MDDARALATRQAPGPRRRLRRLWLGLLASRAGARATGVIGAAYRAAGLARLTRCSGLLRSETLAAGHRVLVRLGAPARVAPRRTPDGTAKGRVALFLGCIARSAQPGLGEAARRVLERLDLAVEIPAGQVCCGAIHRHNGFPEEADGLAAQNQAAFTGHRPVALASACLAELRATQRLGGAADICRLLADLPWPEHLPLRPLPLRVAVHEPCSQRNMLRDERAAYDLLRRIPALELVSLPENDFCCGAAGTYLLQRPGLSRSLLRPKLAALAAVRPSILVTTNTGCALHLAAGIEEAGLGIEVLHPVELVARQLQ